MKPIQKNSLPKTILLLLLFTSSILANFVWYQNEQYVSPVYPVDTNGGIFSTQVDNPAKDNTYTYDRVSKFSGNGMNNPEIRFTLVNPITDLSELLISLTLLADVEQINSQSGAVKVILERADKVGGSVTVQQSITKEKNWEILQYDFTSKSISYDALTAGGYNQLTISFSPNEQGNNSTFFIYEMRGSTIQNPAKKMMGSIGVSLNVWMNDTNYYADSAAAEIVRELPVVGHVIANLSGFALGSRFMIRGNTRVDIAKEIHPNIVAESEERAINAYKTIHKSGKRLILYIAAEHFKKLGGEEREAWLSYCNREFNGDEGAAYRHVIQGFIERTREFADGYWLDHVSPGTTDLAKLVGAIRDVHPDAIVTLNDNFSWIYLGNGEHLRVDSDGINDEDTTDYLVILYENWNNLSDITCGHVGHGPLTSWSYDEKALPNIEENIWSYGIRYNTGYPVLKHLWFPIRHKYHASNVSIAQNIELMYRWTRRVIDAGGAMTWSTTPELRKWPNLNPRGTMMPDEMELMKELQKRLLSSPMPDYEPYVRPEGAYFVGETQVAIKSNALKMNLTPLKVSYRNKTLHFNQPIVKASVVTANGRRVAQISEISNSIALESVSSGVYLVDVELASGMKQSFRCLFK